MNTTEQLQRDAGFIDGDGRIVCRYNKRGELLRPYIHACQAYSNGPAPELVDLSARYEAKISIVKPGGNRRDLGSIHVTKTGPLKILLEAVAKYGRDCGADIKAKENVTYMSPIGSST